MTKPMTDEQWRQCVRTISADCLNEIRRLREEHKRLRVVKVDATLKVDGLEYEIRQLRKEVEHWKDQAWKKTDYAQELKEENERARELLSLCIEDGVGYLQLQNDIRAFLDE